MSSKEISSETIITHAIVMEAAVVVNLVILLLLIRHFIQKRSPHTSLKVLSLASVFMALLSPILQCVLHNNSAFPYIHHFFNFNIDAHCPTLNVSFMGLMVGSKYSIWLFLLCKIQVFFKATPFKLSAPAFYSHVMTYTIISIAIVYTYMMYFEPQIYIGSKDTQHKLCFVSFPKHWSHHVTGAVMDGCLVEMVLLYLLYSKTKQLQSHQTENQDLSPYFSQRDRSLIDAKVIKQCCVGVALTVLTLFVCSVCLALYPSSMVYLSGVPRAVAALSVICSFDIELNVFGSSTANDTAIEDQLQVERHQRQQEYLRRIMEEYYRTPPRLHVHQNSVSIPLS
eukprot:1056563_1